MGEQKNPGDSTDFLVPQVKTPVGGWPIGSLGDYFGLLPLVKLALVKMLVIQHYLCLRII